MPSNKKCYKKDIKTLLSYVQEAQEIHEVWRRDSYEDAAFLDGDQWNASDIQKLKDKGIPRLTINRIFPILNLLQGHYINNQTDIVAKGRTKDDNELAQVMSEGIQFVVDQSHGQQRMQRAFRHEITTGIGYLDVGFHHDPRHEKIAITSRSWYSWWWDPYAKSPWMNKDHCRYGFSADWVDLDDLIQLFPEKEKELREQYTKLDTDYFVPDTYDVGTEIEDYKKYLSSNHWVNSESGRDRVRPVEMWYVVIEPGVFAVMPNGRVIDLDTVDDVHQEYQLVMQSKEVIRANVKRMRVATFLSDLVLQDCKTPYIHDEYPVVPFVGYEDRYGFPYGAVRQAKEQQVEVNKRRSMALALMSSRRVITEKGAAEDENRVYEEANRMDGFIVMKKDKMNRVEIQEMTDLAATQMSMLEQSEREIQEISGANDDTLGYESATRSGVALEQRKQSSATVTASLLENARFSQQILGQRINALIQDTWTDEKVLRVTDRVTGAEKFVSINERTLGDTGITIRNDITQANFDIVVTTKPMTDTMREKNSELIFAAINKAPPEAVGPLLTLALEISDLPQKDQLLQQIRTATGVPEINDDLTQEQREQQQQMEAEAKQAEQQKQTQQQDTSVALEQGKTQAEIDKINAEAALALAKAGAEQQDVNQKGFQIGAQIAQQNRNNKQEENYTPRGKASKPKNPKPKGKDNNTVPQQKVA